MRLTHLAAAFVAFSLIAPGVAHAEDSAPASDPHKTWGIVSLSAGGALLAVGGYSYFRASRGADDAAWQDYRRSVPASEDPCDYAETQGRDDIVDHCNANRRWKTISYVTIPLGLAATVTGVVLLVTRDSKIEKRSAWTLTPAVGRTSGSVDIGYRF